MLLVAVSYGVILNFPSCISYRDFQDQFNATIIGFKSIQDRRELFGVEFD